MTYTYVIHNKTHSFNKRHKNYIFTHRLYKSTKAMICTTNKKTPHCYESKSPVSENIMKYQHFQSHAQWRY